ncbi:MAG: hypothetical protein AB1700_18425, partial [Bacillota bacterium]
MGRVTNKYGETIGYTPGAGYTDYSSEAAGIHGGPQYANTPWSGGGSSGSSGGSSSGGGSSGGGGATYRASSWDEWLTGDYGVEGMPSTPPPASAYPYLINLPPSQQPLIPGWSSAMLDAVKRKAFGEQSAPPQPTWSWPEFPNFQMPQVTPPPKVEAEPTVEGVKPAEPPKAEEKKLPAGMRSGQAGFESVMSPVVAPSVDDLL